MKTLKGATRSDLMDMDSWDKPSRCVTAAFCSTLLFTLLSANTSRDLYMMSVWHDRPNEINFDAQKAKLIFRRADLLYLMAVNMYDCVFLNAWHHSSYFSCNLSPFCFPLCFSIIISYFFHHPLTPPPSLSSPRPSSSFIVAFSLSTSPLRIV